MAENLKTAKNNNQDVIETTSSPTEVAATTDKFQWAYDGNENTVSIYGRMYTWNVVTDVRKLYPN